MYREKYEKTRKKKQKKNRKLYRAKHSDVHMVYNTTDIYSIVVGE